MASLVADTHSTIWYLESAPRLSPTARRAMQEVIERGDAVYVSAVTIAEVTYLVEKGRLEQRQLQELVATLHRPDSGFVVRAFDMPIAEALGRISREAVPDMPDRMIAATSLYLGLPLVSRDHRIRVSGLPTIW